MAFFLSVQTGAFYALCKEFLGLVDLVSAPVLFPIPFLVRKLAEILEFLRITIQCSFDALLTFLAYWGAAEIDWRAVRLVGVCSCKVSTADALKIP